MLVTSRSSNSVPTRLPSAEQTDLPLTGLKDPNGVAVDADGDVYITDAGNRRVLKLAPGSTSHTVLPFTGLNSPGGVAVDASGNVYVADAMRARVVNLRRDNPLSASRCGVVHRNL